MCDCAVQGILASANSSSDRALAEPHERSAIAAIAQARGLEASQAPRASATPQIANR